MSNFYSLNKIIHYLYKANGIDSLPNQTAGGKMRNKLLLSTTLLALSISAFAQKAGDIKRLNSQKENLIKQIEKTEEFLNEDRNQLFTCHSDFQAPFEALQAKALVLTADIKASLDEKFSRIIEGDGQDNLTSLVAAIEARKVELRSEKNKLRKKELKKLLAVKIQQAKEVASILKDQIEPELKSEIQKLVRLDGQIQFAMDEDSSELQITSIFKNKEKVAIANGMSPAENYNIELTSLLNSCSTKDCVHLVSAEVKNILDKTLSLNQNIRIVSGISIKKTKSYAKKKLFKKLDEIVADITKRKPIADLDPSCLPQPAPPTNDEPVDPPSDDDQGTKTDDQAGVSDGPTSPDQDGGEGLGFI